MSCISLLLVSSTAFQKVTSAIVIRVNLAGMHCHDDRPATFSRQFGCHVLSSRVSEIDPSRVRMACYQETTVYRGKEKESSVGESLTRND